ncbi:exodeoxyribonuclease VII small subunit [Arhodomonas sp. AD133]|uniref:exodeoxyribonuclease VII small subunit n=1 Tax=Arhodomonas sp. AD133 TaxID=3415009 RepID=UPI003EBE5C1B
MAEENENGNDGGFDFEAALGELEELVVRMERGDLSLEESLKAFERGVGLTRACQKALTDAEQKVEILLGEDEDATLAPFDEADTDEH